LGGREGDEKMNLEVREYLSLHPAEVNQAV